MPPRPGLAEAKAKRSLSPVPGLPGNFHRAVRCAAERGGGAGRRERLTVGIPLRKVCCGRGSKNSVPPARTVFQADFSVNSACSGIPHSITCNAYAS